MAPDIYERIFLYARRLEECFKGEPSFQYIVTTTTQPPDDFLEQPWMRLRLAGPRAEERFRGWTCSVRSRPGARITASVDAAG